MIFILKNKLKNYLNYNTRQKSLARLDQIAQKCVDKPFWRQKLVTWATPPPPPPTMLEASNDEFITINNIESGGGGRTDKFP